MKVLDSVLLVDDDEMSTRLHENLIKELGLTRQVIARKNGRDALNYIKSTYTSNQKLPALILSDLSMPVMDGFDFIHEMKNSELLGVKNIPIALVSVSAAEKDKKILEGFGNYPLVAKPLDEIKFFHILHHTIVPSLSLEHQIVIMERQRFLEEQRSYLIKQNGALRETLRNIRLRRQRIEEQFFKYKNNG